MSGFYDKVAQRIDKLDAENRRRRFRDLVDEVDFFESVFRAIGEGVLAIGADGTLLYANDAACRLANFKFDASKPKPVRKLLPDWDWDHLLGAPDGGEGWSRSAACELEFTYPERRVLDVSSFPGARGGSVVVLRDVTAERARAEDAVESGRADAVRDLAAGVAHEIGNPLNALALNLEMLAREFRREPDEERRARLLADVQVAREEVKRIDSINRSFLSALRPAAAALAPGSVADPLKDALAEMKTQFEDRQIRVVLDLPPALPSVAVDRAQMAQVFFNLIKNALEAMKDGSSLAIEVASDDRDVSVAFRDSGAGISSADLARIFEPYRTSKKTGNGLGLMICRRIARAHGGDIDVESKPGEGTRFTVRLPRLEKRVRRLT